MRTLPVLLLAVLPSTAFASGDATAGKALYEPCQACHGADAGGDAAKKAPRLAGQRTDYLIRQLTNFADTTRSSSDMHEAASTLESSSDRRNVVAYIDTLEPATPAETVSGDAAAGKAKWSLCFQCHGSRGEGSGTYGTPKLAGQHDWYLKQQLQDFASHSRSGDRYTDQMEQAADALKSDQDIANVVAYINTLE